jgi:hypothetical protein
MLKHDRYVDELCSSIKGHYDILHRNVPLFSKRNRRIAEIDVLAVKGDSCDIYEVKCSHRVAKARKQLKKIRKIISKDWNVREAFFFCGESKTLIQLNN